MGVHALRNKIGLILLIIGQVFYPFEYAFSQTRTYQVREGDSLSEIAQRYVGEPVYPEVSGSLRKVLELNPTIKEPARIRVGQIIILTAEEAPSAVRIPAQLPSDLKLNSIRSERFSILDAQLSFFYSRIEGMQISNSSHAKLLTNLNRNYQVTWTQSWSEFNRTHLEFDSTEISIEGASNRIIENEKISLTHFELGFEHAFNNSLSLEVDLGMGQELFYRSLNSTVVHVDSVVLPQAALKASAIVLELSPFYLGINAKARYLLSGSNDFYAISNGYSYQAGFFLQQKLERFPASVRADIYYLRTEQSTSVINQSRTDGGFKLGLDWSFKP